jgi:enoyl-CoA hydratase/carnithine racemase
MFSQCPADPFGTGVLELALHTDGGTLVFDGHTHEQFADFFHGIGSEPENRIVILTGSRLRFATAGANSKED